MHFAYKITHLPKDFRMRIAARGRDEARCKRKYVEGIGGKLEVGIENRDVSDTDSIKPGYA